MALRRPLSRGLMYRPSPGSAMTATGWSIWAGPRRKKHMAPSLAKPISRATKRSSSRSISNGPANSPQQLTVIAHEFQHLIQYNNDGNEQRWLDEGLAQLAEHLNGFNPHEIASSNLLTFLHYPNFQLNSWPIRLDQDPGVNYT